MGIPMVGDLAIRECERLDPARELTKDQFEHFLWQTPELTNARQWARQLTNRNDHIGRDSSHAAAERFDG